MGLLKGWDMNARSKLAATLKTARINANVTQKQLAKSLGWGTAQYVSNFERGLSTPPVKDIPKICSIINLDTKIVYRLLCDVQVERIQKKFKGKI